MGERHSNQHQPPQGIQFRQAGRLRPGLKRQRRSCPVRLNSRQGRGLRNLFSGQDHCVLWMRDLILRVSGVA
jgi:hypothetical protein